MSLHIILFISHFVVNLVRGKMQHLPHFLKLNVKQNDVSLPTLCQMSIVVVKLRHSHAVS